VVGAGYRYVSSLLWGPEFTMPALLRQPESYADEGHPELIELPGHGWHENVLKAHNLSTQARRILLWPQPFPEAVPPGPLETPEQEFDLNRLFVDRAIAEELSYVSLVWHPWSLLRFDPEMRMLDLTFRHAIDNGLELGTYAGEWERAADASADRLRS
jgi:hypothetical protein